MLLKMDTNKIIELLEEMNQLSAFSIEGVTKKGTLKISFTPIEKEEVELDLRYLKDLTL